MIRRETYAAFDALTSAIDEARTIVLSTHINPDGDGLGSELALRELLLSRGKTVHVINHDPVPPAYQLLDPQGSVLRQYDPDEHDAVVLQADLLLVVDTNHPDRLGDVGPLVRKNRGVKAILDHHLEPDGFADVVIADDTACATGELVYRYLEHAGGLPLSRQTAQALYAAIMTDTGSFRFPKTDGSVHRIVAELVDAGADPSAIYASIYETAPANRMQLLGRALATMELHESGAVCILSVTKEMFTDTGTGETDTDKFVTYAMSIEGVVVGILFSELSTGVKLNVRSKGAIPANEIAKAFGGNGHLNAAGARVAGGTLGDIIPRALKITNTILKKD